MKKLFILTLIATFAGGACAASSPVHPLLVKRTGHHYNRKYFFNMPIAAGVPVEIRADIHGVKHWNFAMKKRDGEYHNIKGDGLKKEIASFINKYRKHFDDHGVTRNISNSGAVFYDIVEPKSTCCSLM